MKKTPAIQKKDEPLLAALIQKDLALDANLSAGNLDDLLKQLERVINQLLDHDLERLLNALYRIDISENKVKEILALEKVDEMAPQLARLIIDREIRKIQTRRLYK